MTSIPPPGGKRQTPGVSGLPSAPSGPPPAPDPEGLTPFSRQVLPILAVLSALLIAVVIYGWRSGQEDANPLSPVFNPIAKAATRTARSPGMRMTMRGSANTPELPGGMAIQASGVYNGKTGRMSMTMSYAAAGQNVSMEVLGGKGVAYIRSSSLGATLPDGAEWLGVEADRIGTHEAVFGDSSSSPRDQLKILTGAGNVRTLGHALVSGAQTTIYGGTVDVGVLADALRSEGNDAAADLYEEMADQVSLMSITVWIDHHGNVRQAEVLMPITANDEHAPIAVDMTIGFSEFGIEPSIQLPDPARVYTPDLSSLEDES